MSMLQESGNYENFKENFTNAHYDVNSDVDYTDDESVMDTTKINPSHPDHLFEHLLPISHNLWRHHEKGNTEGLDNEMNNYLSMSGGLTGIAERALEVAQPELAPIIEMKKAQDAAKEAAVQKAAADKKAKEQTKIDADHDEAMKEDAARTKAKNDAASTSSSGKGKSENTKDSKSNDSKSKDKTPNTTIHSGMLKGIAWFVAIYGTMFVFIINGGSIWDFDNLIILGCAIFIIIALISTGEGKKEFFGE